MNEEEPKNSDEHHPSENTRHIAVMNSLITHQCHLRELTYDDLKSPRFHEIPKFVYVVQNPVKPDENAFNKVKEHVDRSLRSIPTWTENSVLYHLDEEQINTCIVNTLELKKPQSPPTEHSSPDEEDATEESNAVNSTSELSSENSPSEVITEISPSENLNYCLLASNTGSCYILVEKLQSAEETIDVIESALPIRNVLDHNVLISPPNCQHAIFLNGGSEPLLVKSTSESPTAIIKEDNSIVIQESIEYYGTKLGMVIMSSRLLELPENRFVMERMGRWPCQYQKLRMLEFYDPESKIQAMQSLPEDQKVDVLYADGMVGPNTAFNEWRLVIYYSRGVRVILKDPRDKIWTEEVFRAHQLTVKDDASPSDATILLHQFPIWCQKYQQQKVFIREILRDNNIAIDAIELVRKANSDDDCDTSDVPDHATVIQAALENVKAHRKLEKARWELSKGQKRKEGHEEHEHFVVRFPDLPGSHSMMTTIELRTSNVFDKEITVDGITPSIQLLYRCSFQISKPTRVALRDKIRQLGYRFRHFEGSNSLETNSFAQFKMVYMTEEWHNDDQTGLIGVEGWDFPFVATGPSLQLRNLFTPTEYTGGNLSDLFTETGILFVRCLPIRFQGHLVVDVNRHNKKITLLGDRVEEAMHVLANYEAEKNLMCLNKKIWLIFPGRNREIIHCLSDEVIDKIKHSLNLKLLHLNRESAHIDFDGSFASFDVLTGWLKKLNGEVFRQLAMKAENRELIDQICPVCRSSAVEPDPQISAFPCGHSVCRECLDRAVNIHIDNIYDIRLECNVQDCGSKVPPSWILDILCGFNERMKSLDYQKIKKLLLKATDDTLHGNRSTHRLCNMNGCPGIRTKLDYNCKACNHYYCPRCMENFHPDRPCVDDDAMRLYEKEQLQQKGEVVKECPKCYALIQKIDGCDHVQCPECKRHVCFKCLYLGSNQKDVYEHIGLVHGYDFEEADEERAPQDEINVNNEAVPDADGMNEEEHALDSENL